MKTFKKMLSVLMAVAMVMVMAVPALATDGSAGSYSITIDTKGITPDQFQAYQVFKGTLSTDENGKPVLSDIQWGGNIDSQKVAEKFPDKTAEDVAKSLTTAVLAASFADDISECLTGAPTSATQGTEANSAVISLPEPGYYLVKNADATAGAGQAYTKFILEVAGNATATVKTDAPSLDKQIKHNEIEGENAWGVVGDNQIGDTVEFRTITTVPDTTGYEKYDYIIHDTMSEGLTSNVKTADDVTIKVNDENGDGKELDKKYYTVAVNSENPNKFTVTVDIIAAVKANAIKAHDSLYTYYTGTLNEDALIYDEGNQDNEAYLEYSNNPNDTDGKGETPKKKVYDWTFKMEINKIDGATQNEINGAEFALSTDGKLKDGNLDAQKFIKLIYNEAEKTYTVAPEGYEGATTNTIVAGDITIKGLDDATDYYLYETKAPDGYNRLTTPVKFNITAQYMEDGSEYTSVTATVNESAATSLKADIENNAGSTLPSTGGRGTRLFYIVGGVIVVAAAVLLIAKKRMKGNG